MLSRRTLIGSTAVLAAGCGGLDFSFPELGTPKITPLTWVSRSIAELNTGPGIASFEEKLRRMERNLADDDESPIGPERGRYSLALQYVERYAGSYSDPDAEQFRKPEHLAAWLEEVEVDLVTLWPEEARALGERGVLLPLDRFGGADGSDFDREFYSPLLDAFRENGALYALPVGADPLMLYYDVDYLAQMGVTPPDDTWDWDILVANALRLTQQEEDGTVSRWGLAAHRGNIWWALWQNEAVMVDALTSQCRLQEPAAIEALEFFRRLIHTHHVSPAAFSTDLSGLIEDPKGAPPAMLYMTGPPGFSRFNYRSAELPRGKVRSVPVRTDPGIAIVAQTAKPEVAYTALRGLLKAMQPHVGVPSERGAVARLGQFRSDLQPQEVTALQQSMEYGRAMPDDAARRRAIYYMAEALVRGDSVASAVNLGCSILYDNQRT